MHARTRRRRRTAAIGTVAGTLTLLAVAAAGNAVDTTRSTTSTAAPTTPTTTAVADGAIPPALLQRRDKVFDRITRLSTILGKRADIDFSVGVNPNTNTLVVDVFSDKKVKLPDLGTALKVENHIGGQLRENADVSGGAQIQREGAGGCTMGFAVRIDNSPNTPTGFLTAAHCFDETKPAANSKFLIKADNGRIIRGGVGHKYGVEPFESDWGVVALNNDIVPNETLGQVKAFGNKTFPVTGLREPVVGMNVCKHGITTNTTCGEVTAVGVRIAFGNVIADDLVQTSVCVESGDSGGPFFTDPIPNATTVEGVGLVKGMLLYPDPKNPDKACGEKVGLPNISWFVPLSHALTQANDEPPQNDISLLTR